MRSPLGAVNRMAKRLGRIWYSRPRVVSGVPIATIADCGFRITDLIGWRRALGLAIASRSALIQSAIRNSQSAMASGANGRRFCNAPPDHLGDHADLPHQLRELVGEQSLRSVRQGLLGVGVHLDNDAVRPRGDQIGRA